MIHNQLVKAEVCLLTHTNTEGLWTQVWEEQTSNSPQSCKLSLNSLFVCRWHRTWSGAGLIIGMKPSHHSQAGTARWGIVANSYPALNSALVTAPAATQRAGITAPGSYLALEAALLFLHVIPSRSSSSLPPLFVFNTSSFWEVEPSNYRDVWWHTINIESLGMKLITQFATPG